MDEDQSSRPRNGASINITDENPRSESGGVIGRIKRMFGFGRSDETLREIDAFARDLDPRVVQVSALNAGKGESHYLRTKGEAEARLREAEDLDVTILQPSVIFGEGSPRPACSTCASACATSRPT